MRTRTRIHPYVTRDLAGRLNAYSGAKGLTESAVVQSALEGHFDGDEKDNAVIIRRLDRLGRAVVRQQRDLEVLSEAFALFVRIWSAYVPDLSEADREAAKRSGARRFDEYLAHLSQRLASGSRLVKSVVTEDGHSEKSDADTAEKSADRLDR
jgi:hypothetical protein